MKKRVLIVDDDKQLNLINQKILTASGMVSELHIVTNGKEAMEYLQLRSQKSYPLPDIIVLDLHMPVMNGFEFLDAYNDMILPGKYKIEIVVFSATTSQKDKQRVLSKGIKHFLNKPYILLGLKQVIHRLKTGPAEFHSN
jgi:CheY-like chemotaxis protein